MPRLFWPFFIFSIFTGKSETAKVNPNIATFEELISIPILTEEEAINIITIRAIKEFSSISELIERTGIDSSKIDYLEEIFIFEDDKKYHLQMYISHQQEGLNSYLKLAFKNYFASSYADSVSWGAYIGNSWLTLGKFELQISPYTLKPIFNSKCKSSYNLCLSQPLIVAIGLEKLQIGFPFQIKSADILLTPLIFYKGKVYWEWFAKSSTKPLKLYTYLSTLNKTGVVKIHLREQHTNFSAQARVLNKSLFLDCNISRILKTGESFYLRLTNKGSRNASYLEYCRILPSGCAITVGATLSGKCPELYSVKIHSRSLTLQYAKGQMEKITIITFFNPISFKMNYYPQCNILEYMLTTNLAIHPAHFKIAISWKNEKIWNLSLNIKANAKKRQGNNFKDG
ncbi:MAG: hypothetical protein QMD82_00880 [bacterium]|nr:hypothetical protein [bacterium]